MARVIAYEQMIFIIDVLQLDMFFYLITAPFFRPAASNWQSLLQHIKPNILLNAKPHAKQSCYEIFVEKSDTWKLHSRIAIPTQLFLLQQFMQIIKMPSNLSKTQNIIGKLSTFLKNIIRLVSWLTMASHISMNSHSWNGCGRLYEIPGSLKVLETYFNSRLCWFFGLTAARLMEKCYNFSRAIVHK